MAIFKKGNGESRNGMARRKPGTRKHEIFKPRNEKTWTLNNLEREKMDNLKAGTRKYGIFKSRKEKIWNL